MCIMYVNMLHYLSAVSFEIMKREMHPSSGVADVSRQPIRICRHKNAMNVCKRANLALLVLVLTILCIQAQIPISTLNWKPTALNSVRFSGRNGEDWAKFYKSWRFLSNLIFIVLTNRYSWQVMHPVFSKVRFGLLEAELSLTQCIILWAL